MTAPLPTGGVPCNDREAARLIASSELLQDKLHYGAGSGTWYLWDGTCHRPDDGGVTGQAVLWFADRWRAELEAWRAAYHQRTWLDLGLEADPRAVKTELEKRWKADGHDQRTTYVWGLARSGGHKALMHMLSVVCSVPDSLFDEQHPRWLNCRNGTVNLETGAIKPHDPSDMLTYCVPVAYKPQESARCPRFWQLAWRMAGGDYEVAAYVVLALGYALLGENPEQLIFFIDGPTKSGKSVLLTVARAILGPLAHESQAELICVPKGGNRNARTENSIRGKRLITITETSAFMHIDEGQLKRLTGEAIISVNQHYAKTELKTPVTFTGFVAANDLPSLLNFDDAMGERISVVPGGPTIPAGERDKRLAEKIIAEEGESVLAFLVKACVEYHRSGLVMPHAVRMKTDRYRGQQDTVANFIADCCIMVPPGWGQVTAQIQMTDAWAAYRRWARGEIRLGKQAFFDHMARQPGVTKVDNGSRARRFEGLCWNDRMMSMLGDLNPESHG